MPSIVTLVIYLSAADAADPSTPALLRSAREVLGNQAQITLRTSDSELTDSGLASADPAADAVAGVAWPSADHRLAAVRCYIGKLHRLLKREVGFDEDADPRERERMLGFVIASMLPSESEASSETAAQPDGVPVPLDSPVPAAMVPNPRVEREHFVGMAEVVGLGATGIDGSASSFGASLAVRWLFSRSLSLRLAGGLRRGDIPVASATSEVEFLGLGLAFESLVRPDSRFALGGRLGVLALRHEVDHLSSDDREPDRRSRLLPGADGFFEGNWRFSASAAVLAGVGAEVAFGHTDLFVKSKEVASIPVTRALFELGIQAKF